MTEQGSGREFLTVKEVAARLRVDDDTVYGWLADGSLQGLHLGGRRSWSIEPAALEAFIEASKTGHTDGRESLRKPRKMAANLGGPQRLKLLKGKWMEKYAR